MQADGYHDVASAYQAVSLYEDVWARARRRLHGLDLGHRRRRRASPPTTATSRCARRGCSRSRPGTTAACISTSTSTCRSPAAWAADRRMPRPLSSRAMRCGAPTSAARELHRLAARLGADVPFALMGGTAIGTGRGDQLSPALAKGRFDWVVVPSPDGLSTPEVYAHLDVLRADGERRPRDIGRTARTPESTRRAAGAARRRSRRARRARPQRPAGRRAVAAPAAARCARARRAVRRARRAWSRAPVRRSRSWPPTPSRRSSCRSRSRRRA